MNGAEGFERAAHRFSGFFSELNATFLEREDVLAQAALALLSREHVLLTGPPGTAKSQLARAVLGRIIDATTGEPSLFARQFTENTVLTDLVGAIDFKTLMDTGRTEHFTDEGIIGSVHAFLDEVFDGRDMLLRSTLNLLGERELKQGVRTTRGRVECSLMTSNRYLTEVLDESRETLLAFVDRIAFVGFVPKGFSSPEPMRQVMRQNVAGQAARLRAYLSIQDVDLLQNLVDQVRFPQPATDRLVAFLDLFDAEMQAAVRGTPDFAPSRYLSIRTRVRAGKILKAVVVYRKIFEEPARSLEVTLPDFAYLRYVLLQSGPPKALLEQLAREQDAREARQLKIIRIEREVFERSLARLDSTSWASAPSASPAIDLASAADRPIAELVELLGRTSGHAPLEHEQALRLEQWITRRIIEHGVVTSSGDAAERAALAGLAESLETLRGPVDPLTQWLRARCLVLLEAAVQKQALVVEALGEKPRRAIELIEQLGVALQQMRAFRAEADELRARQNLPQVRLEALFLNVVGAVTNRLREALHHEVAQASSGAASSSASARLEPVLAALDGFVAVAQQTHPAFEPQLAGLTSSLLWPIAAQALSPLATTPRHEYLSRFDAIWAELTDAHLARHVPFERLLTPALEHAGQHDEAALNGALLPPVGECSPASYDAFRRGLPRAPIGYLAIQLCLRADGSSILEFAGKPELATFALRLAKLPEPLRTKLGRLDTLRVAKTLEFLRRWLSQARAPGAAEAEIFELLSVLERDEVLARLRLEAELTEALFAEAAPECQALCAGLDALSSELGPAAALAEA
jgi:MoxR-like ATPase